MKVLLTGASSFTGFWFAKTLREKGHEVRAPLRGQKGEYTGTRLERVNRLDSLGVHVSWETPFGSDRFLDLVDHSIDLIGHHAAHVENYKSLDFDVVAALQNNTQNIRALFERATRAGVKAIIHTGSVFEEGEGCGEAPLRAFSPYGLSKGLTHKILSFWAERFGIPLAKFVIPNPFGPFEKPRFCDYLLKCWTNKSVAAVKTPDYVRDNIPVSLLALCYVDFLEKIHDNPAPLKLGPMGYVETQGAFAQRFAREIGRRLQIECPVDLLNQTDFSEPMIRINTDRPDIQKLGWNDERAWDELAKFYEKNMC